MRSSDAKPHFFPVIWPPETRLSSDETKCSCVRIQIFLACPGRRFQSCFPCARSSLTKGSHPSVTIAGQTPRWLGETPKHHRRKTNQRCLNDCSRQMEGETNSFAGQSPRRRVQGVQLSPLTRPQETHRWESKGAQPSSHSPGPDHSDACYAG